MRAGIEAAFIEPDARNVAVDVCPELDPGLYKMTELYQERPWPELKVIHFDVPGPYTFGLTSKDQNDAPAFYNDQMKDIIIKHLAMKANWRDEH